MTETVDESIWAPPCPTGRPWRPSTQRPSRSWGLGILVTLSGERREGPLSGYRMDDKLTNCSVQPQPRIPRAALLCMMEAVRIRHSSCDRRWQKLAVNSRLLADVNAVELLRVRCRTARAVTRWPSAHGSRPMDKSTSLVSIPASSPHPSTFS